MSKLSIAQFRHTAGEYHTRQHHVLWAGSCWQLREDAGDTIISEHKTLRDALCVALAYEQTMDLRRNK